MFSFDGNHTTATPLYVGRGGNQPTEKYLVDYNLGVDFQLLKLDLNPGRLEILFPRFFNP